MGARPFSAREAFALLAVFLGNVGANTVGLNGLADWLFVGELVFLFSLLKRRCHAGGELPPPSFVLGVATRAVFGHSGGREKLDRFHPWLIAAALLMLIGLASRISGDFLPGTQSTHYLYAAGCWMAGAVLWAACVLPHVLRPDPEG